MMVGLCFILGGFALACPRDPELAVNSTIVVPGGIKTACGDIEKGYMQVYKPDSSVRHVEIWKLYGNAITTYGDLVKAFRKDNYVLQPKLSGITKIGPVDVFLDKTTGRLVSAHLFGDERIGMHVALRMDW